MTPLDIFNPKILGNEFHIKSNLVSVRRSPFQIRLPELNSDIAYLSGVIFGDGNLTLIKRRDSRYPRTKLKVYNSSRDFLLELNEIIHNNFNYNGRIYKKKDKNCYILELNNKIIWLYFTEFIRIKPKKKINLHIPYVLRNKGILKYFIAGLFDTDGYFSRGRFGIMMNGKNYIFLKEIKTLTREFYNFNFLGPYKDKIELNGKIRYRVQINLSTICNSMFLDIIPLRKKSGPGKI